MTNEVNIKILKEHLKPGTFWREYADRVGIEAVLVLAEMRGGERLDVATTSHFVRQAMRGILYP